MRIKPFLRYCVARLNERAKTEAYRIYVTDALRVVAENTARFASGNYIKARYADMIEPKKQDNRTGDEIVTDIIKRAGLVVKSE